VLLTIHTLGASRDPLSLIFEALRLIGGGMPALAGRIFELGHGVCVREEEERG